MTGAGRYARTLMVQGTASGVGKSWLVAGLCRVLRRRGIAVAPFKAQNMSNNAAVTSRGGEVGRAQAVQAEAAGVDVDERMNPVLLKPLADTRSDVVLRGVSRPDLAEIPWTERRSVLWPEVASALDALRGDFDWVVIEGAGSPAEINLADSDIVNMAVARYADAPVILVADIDRGGAFASLVGTWELMRPADRARLRGFVLNRFRGDPALLGDAPEVVRRHTGVETLGVVPWVSARLPDEDAAVIERASEGADGTVAVVRLPRIANFDDVLPLERMPGVGVRWADRPEALDGAAAIVLPGSRNVVADLDWLHASGLGGAIRERAGAGVPVLGLCGGLQMLGRTVEDPEGIEGGATRAGGSARQGLGLLPVSTVLEGTKTVRRVTARWSGPSGRIGVLSGYEIHHGRTRSGSPAFVHDEDDPERELGYRSGRVWGTYVHGCLSDPAFRNAWLALAGLPAAPTGHSVPATLVDRTPEFPGPDPIDVVADAVEGALDIDEILAR
ncbi:MAG: cobyric acid synthase [Gemmatimonadota bacterium]|nr:cobyric acid synthase [Gemmatimonadota bacterium]